MNRNISIAAAIAAVLGTGTAFAQATNPPNLTQAAGAPVKLYISGSSAAQAAVTAAAEVSLCGGILNSLAITGSPNANFLAFSCAPASGTAGADGNTYYTVYYRTEGGSVTGALPIVNNVQLNELDLTNANITCSTSTASANLGQSVCTATVSGTSAANGIDDSFSGAITKVFTNLGIMDVEPSALVGNNYPTAYLASAWGPNAESTLGSTVGTQLFDQVFGIYVNEKSGTASTIFTENPLNLSTETVANILNHKIRNWNLVTDVSGQLVANASLPITIVNREQGSGSRTTIDLLVMGDTCDAGSSAISDPSGVDYFATGDVLNAKRWAGTRTPSSIKRFTFGSPATTECGDG